MDKFEKICLELKKNSLISNRQKGDLFERFIKQYLLTEKMYCEIIDKVWLWSEFPYRDNKPDTGIDIVVKIKDIDEYWAIQCKFYDEKYSIQKGDVDTFLSTSSKYFLVDGKKTTYTHRYLISTTDKWSKNAEDSISNQTIPVTRIRLKDIKNSSIDWESFSLDNMQSMHMAPLKKARRHQEDAIKHVVDEFKSCDRGKLIMACGTGKTFTSLKIVEKITQGKGNVLFLVPSISLLNQTLIEWSEQCIYDYEIYAVCSDPKASNTSELIDTVIPATTNAETIAKHYSLRNTSEKLNMFFSTYQSINVINDIQKKIGFEFDIIICDEAHRTTGVTLANENESNFVKVHDNDFIKAKKRLYMTATPRIYAEESKNKATNNNALICSMDDEKIYGKELHKLTFSEAVSLGLLVDYKVIVLAVDEEYVSRSLQKLLTDESNELNLDDSVKIIGCLNGLSKKTLFSSDEESFKLDPEPMKRAVAFCSRIKDSKKFVKQFEMIIDELRLNNYDRSLLDVQLEHVDGTNNALIKKEKIDWLKEVTPEGTCRVLSNARCLSEGIDVPALDTVMFLSPRNSIVDIIQSVGRVMRKADNKKYGYIILPIGIPAGVEPDVALNDNRKYKVVWDVLQALRAHDDRFNNMINKIDLNKKKPYNLNIIGVTSETNISIKSNDEYHSRQLSFNLEEMEKWRNCIYAKIVKKCGTRRYWEVWAKDIAEIAQRHINQINILLEDPKILSKFNEFVDGLKNNLNQSITKESAIEMLAEHLITKPVFEALFEDYEFIKNNPVSIIMQDMLEILNQKALDKEQETLDKFYLKIQERAKGIDNAEGKQKIIIELYENFFKNALPKQVEKLGIVYTPIEVVDFIINSVEYILKKEFGSSLSEKGVHVLDPFTGTGTFIVQLLRSGFIDKQDLLYKYTNEIHANEIVLLAYYIAAINIEETFHELSAMNEYTPFEGIVLTDTFELSESYKRSSGNINFNKMFYKNSDRALRELETPIKVIIGNPPYSVGQKSGNDNNQNMVYEFLDKEIANTYVKYSKASLRRNAYDTYIKAFRWATDRIEENGVVAFVTNGAFIDSQSLDGFRKCLLDDYNSIYCFNLRGNQRTSGELSRKEGGKIFGSGSRTPVAITVLVRKKDKKFDRFIHYYDIGDYLSRQQKLDIISEFNNISNISWQRIVPDNNNDWINLKNPRYSSFIALGNKKSKEKYSVFDVNYASGLSTSRDVWIYNFDKNEEKANAERLINNYNEERVRCNIEYNKEVLNKSFGEDKKIKETFIKNIRKTNPEQYNWSSGLTNKLVNNVEIKTDGVLRIFQVRPFTKVNAYYKKDIIERCSIWDNIFPDDSYSNLVMCVSGAPLKKGFSVLMTNCIQDLHLLENSQCFPFYIYDKDIEEQVEQYSLFEESSNLDKKLRSYKKKHTINDLILKKFKDMYGTKITKKDIFFYIYAVLHHKKYRELYKDNLAKEMPRIPFLNKFTEYVKIGRQLSELHVNYENYKNYKNYKDIGLEILIEKENYIVDKMKFFKEGKKVRKDRIIYNNYIEIRNIPLKVYEYQINGKAAVEWIMEKYSVTIDKNSKIKNDPNRYSNDSKYILELLISIIALSLRTEELIDKLPKYEEI